MLQGPRTLGRLFRQRINRTPDRYALGWIDNNEVKSMTFTDYKNHIEVLVNAFNKVGVNIGDKVAILSLTCKEWHLFDMTTLLSRACVVPVYPSYLANEITYIFNHSDSSVLIVENDKQMEKVIPLLKDWPNLKIVISINELSEDTLKKFRNSYPYYSYKDLIRLGLDTMKSQPDFFENQIENQQPEEYASIIYTSGTTGEPKGALITQHGLTTMLLNVEKTIKASFTANDKTLTFLPLSHVLGRCDSLLPLVFGWQAVYAESIDKLIDNIQIVKPTIMLAVPRIFEKIYSKVNEQIEGGSFIEKQAFKWATNIAENYYSKIDRDLSPSALEMMEYQLAYKLVFSKIYNRFGGKIRYFVSGGAPLSPQIIKFLRYANLTILEGYGLTETIAPCSLNPLAKQVPGTVGRPMGDVEFSFGPDGEILIRTESMMKEYYKNPKATAETIKDGWLHSGDIGEFTAEGYLKITDRKKDILITSGGKNVAPQKIENMAKSKPHISQMVVIGDKRNYLTALIGIDKDSFLSILDDLNLPTDCSLEDLARHPTVREILQNEIDEVNSELAQYETIKKFEIISEEFTTDNFLTPSLKVKRKIVSEHYKARIEAMY
ncbi:MAG TPA: long-chain fatty acid--CoA ligase [Bacteriovoracaceae bacterium]|nr:long-chain fatty acid--CoA ligase [Bacteriovoracaceae bacterium]